MKKWTKISSELVFDNKWFKVQKDVVKLSTGKIIDDYHMWKNNDVALIVAMTSDKKILLEKQYKHAADDLVIEVPAGFSDDNEDTIETAKRELLEETGYIGEEPILLGSLMNNPTKELGKTNVYLINNAHRISEPSLDSTEDIEVAEYTLEEVLTMIDSGTIITSGTIAAILLLIRKLKINI